MMLKLLFVLRSGVTSQLGKRSPVACGAARDCSLGELLPKTTAFLLLIYVPITLYLRKWWHKPDCNSGCPGTFFIFASLLLCFLLLTQIPCTFYHKACANKDVAYEMFRLNSPSAAFD